MSEQVQRELWNDAYRRRPAGLAAACRITQLSETSTGSLGLLGKSGRNRRAYLEWCYFCLQLNDPFPDWRT